MTKMLYQTDSYLKEVNATITRLDSDARAVVLDQSAFYPGGGGQPNDRGELIVGDLTYTVEKVKKQGNEVLHFFSGDLPLPESGVQAYGRIEWKHRYSLMRVHTALHILCGVVFRDYGALVTGGNMESGKGRMDFEFETLRGELVSEIEESVNREVEAGRDVVVKILPREEAFQIPDLIRTKINLLPEGITEVRTVEIVDLDLQADGGTHVKNTSEVGQIKVVDYKSKGAINKRIYIEVV